MSGKSLCILFFSVLSIIVFFAGISCVKSDAKTENKSYIEVYEDERFRVERHSIHNDKEFGNHFVVESITIDKETGVQYMDGKPLLDSEGNLLLYKEGE